MPEPNIPPVQPPATPAPVVPPPVTPAAVIPPATPPAPVVPAVVIPDKYTLKLGDNSPLDAADIEKIAAYARTQGLSNDQAVALLKHQEATASGLVARQQAQLAEITQAWATEVKTDKDIGGAAYATTLANVQKAVDRFASPAFKTWVNESGLGNHPEFVRFVNAIGKAMREESTILTGSPGGDPPKTLAQRIYGT